RRRRRHHGRGASQPRGGVVGWRADALPGPVHAADARSADHRGGHRSPRRRARRCRSLMPMLLLLLALQNLQDPGPALDRASATYQTIRTLSAEFTQIITNPLLGAPDTTRGRLYQMRPNHFAMRFTRPRGDRIVADGRHLWLYTPSTTPGQVIRTGIPSSGATGPNLIAQFVEHPDRKSV